MSYQFTSQCPENSEHDAARPPRATITSVAPLAEGSTREKMRIVSILNEDDHIPLSTLNSVKHHKVEHQANDVTTDPVSETMVCTRRNCSQPQIPNSKRCRQHHYRNIYMRERYHQQKRLKKCFRCGNSLPANYKTASCESCRQKMIMNDRNRKRSLRLDGKCRDCSESVEQGYARCQLCMEKQRRAQNQNYKLRKKKAKAAGKCLYCPAPSDQGFVSCSSCRKKKQDAKRERNHRK